MITMLRSIRDVATHGRSVRTSLPSPTAEDNTAYGLKMAQSGSTKIVTVAVLAIVAGILAIAVLLLPKGFSDDLTVIGRGTSSVVLTHDKNLVASTEMMQLLNKIRPDYQDKIQFLAVDVVTPIGIRFVREQQVGVVELVIFDGKGNRQQVLRGGASEVQLRAALDTVARL